VVLAAILRHHGCDERCAAGIESSRTMRTVSDANGRTATPVTRTCGRPSDCAIVMVVAIRADSPSPKAVAENADRAAASSSAAGIGYPKNSAGSLRYPQTTSTVGG
jgi:hypothetical protein